METGLRIIAFAGPAGSGKDTCADELARQIRSLGGVRCEGRGVTVLHAVRRFALATPLREACDALGLSSAATREEKDRPCADLEGRTGRDLLVALGRAVREVGGPGFMTRRFLAAARDWANIRSRAWAVVSDLRTAEEARLLREAGATLVWVDRPGDRPDVWLQPEVRAACDRTLDNSRDLPHLLAQVAALAGEVVR